MDMKFVTTVYFPLQQLIKRSKKLPKILPKISKNVKCPSNYRTRHKPLKVSKKKMFFAMGLKFLLTRKLLLFMIYFTNWIHL